MLYKYYTSIHSHFVDGMPVWKGEKSNKRWRGTLLSSILLRLATESYETSTSSNFLTFYINETIWWHFVGALSLEKLSTYFNDKISSLIPIRMGIVFI